MTILENLNSELNLLNKNISISAELYSITEQINLRQLELEKLNNQKVVQTNIIGETRTSISKPRKVLISSLSAVAGFFISIFLPDTS